MEVRDIIMAIGFLIIFFYQRHKMGSLETQIKSQKGILGSAETFFKLFDLEKLKGYGEILAEKTKVEMEVEVQKVKENLEEKINKQKDTIKLLAEETFPLINAFIYTFLRLPRNLRKEAINRMGNGILKEMVIKTNEELEEKEEMKLTGLLEFLSKRKNEVDSK